MNLSEPKPHLRRGDSHALRVRVWCALALLLLAFCSQALHDHGLVRDGSHDHGGVHLSDHSGMHLSMDAAGADTCPLCVAMHSAVRPEGHRAVETLAVFEFVPASAAKEAFEAFSGYAYQSRPPPDSVLLFRHLLAA